MSERLTKFLRSVQEFADSECSALEYKAQSFKDENISEYTEIESKKNKEYIDYETSRIKNDVNCKLSQYESQKKEALVSLRNELSQKVFSEVEEKIKSFTFSDEYLDFLLNSVKEIQNLTDDKIEIHLRQEDLKYSEQIKNAVNCTIIEDNSIILGGVKSSLNGGRLSVDDTLDKRLLLQKDEFTRNSNLEIV